MSTAADETGHEQARAALARLLIRQAREALEDAEHLLERNRLRGATLRCADAALLAGRALLVPQGYDRSDLSEVTILVDHQLVATEVVSRRCGLAVHQALRARRECEDSVVPVLYPARDRTVLEGVGGLIAEAEIVLDRSLPEPQHPPQDDYL